MIVSDIQAPLPGTVHFDLAPKAGGLPYRIFLRVPAGPAPAGGWPTLYLLDGNAMIGTAVDAVRVQAAYPKATGMREAALIAIGYPTDEAYDSVRRSWDMVPPPGATYPPYAPGGPELKTGGANTFLAFIEDELKPEIARRLPVDKARQAIFGHSFGGLCVLHALFTRPGTFAHYAAISPAIGWEDAVLLKGEAGFVAQQDGTTRHRVLIAAAEFEQALAPFQELQDDAEERRSRNAQSRTMEHARDLHARLAALPGVHAEFAVMEGETHMSILPVAINRTVRFVLGPDAP
ncbi:alpha/beta hydrolase [Xanthobacteraceae bacterium A53D]